MTASTAAHVILGNTSLAAEHAPFYRHEPSADAGSKADEQVAVSESG